MSWRIDGALSRPTAHRAGRNRTGGWGGGRGGRSGGGVGEPGRGALTLATAGQARGGGAAAPGGRAAAPAGAPGAAPGSAAAAAGVAPGGLPGGARAGGPGGGGGGRGGPFVPGDDAAYVVGSDGYLHALNVQNGWENMTPSCSFPRIPARRVSSSPPVRTASAVAYAATTHGCGSQPDGVWAMDLGSAQKAVTAFRGERRDHRRERRARPWTRWHRVRRHHRRQVAAVERDHRARAEDAEAQRLGDSARGSVRVLAARLPASRGSLQPRKTRTSSSRRAAASCSCSTASSLANGPIATSPPYAPPDTDGSAPGELAGRPGHALDRATVRARDRGDEGRRAGRQARRSRPAGRRARLPPRCRRSSSTACCSPRSSGARPRLACSTRLTRPPAKISGTAAKTITSTVRGGLSAGQGNVYVPGADGTLYAFGFAIEK